MDMLFKGAAILVIVAMLTIPFLLMVWCVIAPIVDLAHWVARWLAEAVAPGHEIEKPAPPWCPHDDWDYHFNPPGMGTCTKCGRQLKMSILLNNWKTRSEREMREQVLQEIRRAT